MAKSSDYNVPLALPDALPDGGTTGQALLKLSNTDQDFGWGDNTQGASQVEVDAGINNTKFVSPATLKGHLPMKTLAYVLFDGTGTPSISNSYNVSSITDNGVGLYTLNFTTSLPTADYNYLGMAESSGGSLSVVLKNSGGVKTVDEFQIRISASNNAGADRNGISVLIFGDN